MELRALNSLLWCLCWALIGCQTASQVAAVPPTPGLSAHAGGEKTAEELGALYDEWDQLLKSELGTASCWVWGDQRLNKQLGQVVVSRPAFFLERLRENMFVLLILQQSPLYERNREQLSGLTSLQARQAVWKDILNGAVAKRTESRAHDTEARPVSGR